MGGVFVFPDREMVISCRDVYFFCLLERCVWFGTTEVRVAVFFFAWTSNFSVNEIQCCNGSRVYVCVFVNWK